MAIRYRDVEIPFERSRRIDLISVNDKRLVILEDRIHGIQTGELHYPCTGSRSYFLVISSSKTMKGERLRLNYEDLEVLHVERNFAEEHEQVEHVAGHSGDVRSGGRHRAEGVRPTDDLRKHL